MYLGCSRNTLPESARDPEERERERSMVTKTTAGGPSGGAREKRDAASPLDVAVITSPQRRRSRSDEAIDACAAAGSARAWLSFLLAGFAAYEQRGPAHVGSASKASPRLALEVRRSSPQPPTTQMRHGCPITPISRRVRSTSQRTFRRLGIAHRSARARRRRTAPSPIRAPGEAPRRLLIAANQPTAARSRRLAARAHGRRRRRIKGPRRPPRATFFLLRAGSPGSWTGGPGQGLIGGQAASSWDPQARGLRALPQRRGRERSIHNHPS